MQPILQAITFCAENNLAVWGSNDKTGSPNAEGLLDIKTVNSKNNTAEGKDSMFPWTLVSTYKSKRRHNPEKQHRHLHRRENFKFHIY
jgi:hypothetical protein